MMFDIIFSEWRIAIRDGNENIRYGFDMQNQILKMETNSNNRVDLNFLDSNVIYISYHFIKLNLFFPTLLATLSALQH